MIGNDLWKAGADRVFMLKEGGGISRISNGVSTYSLDNVVASLPGPLQVAMKTAPPGCLQLFSPVIGSWEVTDPALRKAAVLLQILGDKLVRVSADVLDVIRRAALVAVQA
jgi:hypothetical protein